MERIAQAEHRDASFWRSLAPAREAVLRNALPALVLPTAWMTLVSFVTGIERIRLLAWYAVGPLSGVAAGLLALAWIMLGRRRGFSGGQVWAVALALTAVAAMSTSVLSPFYAVWRPGLTGPGELATVGLLAGLFTAALYANRRRRALRSPHQAASAPMSSTARVR